MTNDRIKAQHLARIAYVYVRQSTQFQAQHNLESQRRQYQMVEKAKQLGFRDIQVIDDDLGVSGAGKSERSGFNKLVAEVSLNKVGLILGLEVSRFARNNKDWYHLIDLCALFDTLIADQDGIYHPASANDRMVLGVKGTMSEVELNLIKQRMLEGARNKAKRGELIYRLPVGLVKTEDNQIEKDPDKRIQKTIEYVFAKFSETYSVRQTFLWFVQEGISFPVIEYGKFGKTITWKRPSYGTIYDVLKNPFYAGAYVYGRRESRTYLEGDKIKRKSGYPLDMEKWQVLLKENHDGYIGWQDYIKNQEVMKDNNPSGFSKGAVLKGNGLISGLLRCKRCGNRLTVSYGGKNSKAPIYSCQRGRLRHGHKGCISFGGLRADAAVSQEVLKVVEPLAIEASIKAIEEFNGEVNEEIKLIELELENAEYEAQRAYRQYNLADPENRMVCANLETKWNNCLERVEQIKERLQKSDKTIASLNETDKKELLELSFELPELWNAPSTTNELRKRIIRSVVKEIMCDIDEENNLIDLQIHWEGGIHTQLKVRKNRTGEHRYCTDKTIVEIVKELSKILPDKAIAPILNRLKLKTGRGNHFTRDRVRSLRSANGIRPYDPKMKDRFITLQKAAEHLGICSQSVRGLIREKIIDARQTVSCAPWIIRREEIEKEAVKTAVNGIKNGSNRRNQFSRCDNQLKMFQ